MKWYFIDLQWVGTLSFFKGGKVEGFQNIQ